MTVVSDKIEGWGLCSKACQDNRDGFSYANLNLLTDEECMELTRFVSMKEHLLVVQDRS